MIPNDPKLIEFLREEAKHDLKDKQNILHNLIGHTPLIKRLDDERYKELTQYIFDIYHLDQF